MVVPSVICLTLIKSESLSGYLGGHLIRIFCDRHGGSTFLVAGDERLTFTGTHAASKTVALALMVEGIIKGDRVGIAMRNSPAWIVPYMGIVVAGDVTTLLNG
ncbi:AMP-binding protein [Sphingomonas sp.]|uniref:AMP-binding protein n=1 Tax=Sphingomonas sp. TaxID=28214 RepID=UPI0035C79CCA